MSDPSPMPEQPLSATAAQQPSPAAASQPDQQPIDVEQPQQPQQQENTELDDIPQHPQHPPSPPFFQPLFTLVTDSTTGATHHAHVHYIFSDDEPDLLTDALGQYSAQHQATSSSSGSSPAKPADRAIILDLVPKPPPATTASSSDAVPTVPNSYEVAWASSLSADWAVVSAKVNPMSADEDDSAPARGVDGADAQQLMLRIEGVDSAALRRPPKGRTARKASPDLSSGSSSGVGQPGQHEDYGAIVDEFDKRMVLLRRVMDAGRERQLKLALDGAESGPGEPPVAEVLDHLASHASVGHEPPDDALCGSRRASDGDGGVHTGSKRSSGGSGGHAEWEHQPVA